MNDSRSFTRSSLIKLFSLLFVLAGGMTALEAQESPNQGNVSLSVGTNLTSAYFFRGFLQEDDGIISQPYVDISSTLYDGDKTSVSANLGVWNSVHSENSFEDPNTTEGRGALYEQDVYGGVSFSYTNWTLGISYIFYTYPNGAFSTIHEIDYTLSYDDSDLLGDYALSPYVTFADETDIRGTAGGEGSYLELGISPGMTLAEDNDHPVSVSLPVTAGFSIDDYYVSQGDDDALGYTKLGPHVSVPLASGTKWGDLTLSGGVDWYYLAADATEASNNGDESEFVGSVSLGLSY